MFSNPQFRQVRDLAGSQEMVKQNHCQSCAFPCKLCSQLYCFHSLYPWGSYLVRRSHMLTVNNKRGQEIVSSIGVTKTCHEATGKSECSSKWRILGHIIGEMGLEGVFQGIQCQDRHVQMHGDGHAWGC